MPKNHGFSADNFNLKKNFNLTFQICNKKFVTKNENPANVLECKPIEMFWYMLIYKAEVYKDD